MLNGVPARQFAKELYQETSEDDIFNGAAALGFYLTLAIFPAMIFLMAVIPYLPIANVDQAIMDLLRQALPPSAADMFQGVVQEITGQQRGGLLSFGIIATLWASSAGMYAIMQQLNITYDVKESRGFVKARLTAIGLSVLFTVLILGGFSLIVLGGQIQEWLGQRLGFSDALLWFFVAFRWAMIVLGLLLAFALIYYLAPNVEQRFVFITPGSILGVLMLVIASVGFAFYAQNFGNYNATYGSIGAVIILMLWLYIAGLSILVGSEINSLVEHHSAEGKEKGERVEGEAARNPAVRERVRQAAPEGEAGGGRELPHAATRGGRQGAAGGPAVARGGINPRPESIGSYVLTLVTLAAVATLARGGNTSGQHASGRGARSG